MPREAIKCNYQETNLIIKSNYFNNDVTYVELGVKMILEKISVQWILLHIVVSINPIDISLSSGYVFNPDPDSW